MWFTSADTQHSRGGAFEREEQAGGFVTGLSGCSTFPDTDTDNPARPLHTAISARLGDPRPRPSIGRPPRCGPGDD